MNKMNYQDTLSDKHLEELARLSIPERIFKPEDEKKIYELIKRDRPSRQNAPPPRRYNRDGYLIPPQIYYRIVHLYPKKTKKKLPKQ